MIKLIATIKLTDSNQGSLNSANFTNANNISGGSSTIVGRKNTTGSPFILSSNGNGSKIGSGDYMVTREKYFIGSVSSDAYGNFSSGSYVISVSGSDIKTLNIEFDSKNKLHPKTIIVNGSTYTDDDPIFTIGFAEPQSSINIEIKDWNKPNSSLVITGIYVDVEINLDERSITGFEYNFTDREYNDKPSYGIVSSSGSISFNDSKRDVIDYIKAQLIDKSSLVDVYIKNTNYSTKYTVAKTYTDQWQYDNDNFLVSVTLKDNLDGMQNCDFSGLVYSGSQKTGKEIYEYILAQTPAEFLFPTFSELDSNTQNFLTTNYIKFPYMENSSLWSAWDKFCWAFCCKIYKNEYGITIVKHSVI